MKTEYELDIEIGGEYYTVGFDTDQDIDYNDNYVTYPVISHIILESTGEELDLDSMDDDQYDYIAEKCTEFMREVEEERAAGYSDDM